MDELRWMAANEMRLALGKISLSSLQRRTIELRLVERGYVVRLGRRLLYASNLVTDLPKLLQSKKTYKEEENA